MNPKIKENVYIREINDEKVIYDMQNEQVHLLNSTASFIFELCDGSNTKDDIMNCMIDCYEVSNEKAAEDIDNVIKDLKKNFLLAEESGN